MTVLWEVLWKIARAVWALWMAFFVVIIAVILGLAALSVLLGLTNW